jgi:hypothetical protein
VSNPLVAKDFGFGKRKSEERGAKTGSVLRKIGRWIKVNFNKVC